MQPDHFPATNPRAIILFDGVCNLCNAAVQFILMRDKAAYFSFSSLQSASGQKLIRQYGIDTRETDSIILIMNGKVYTRSAAVLRITKKLRLPWPLFSVFLVLPPFIRDAVYKFIAKRRYSWFGRKEECMLPQPEWENRFI